MAGLYAIIGDQDSSYLKVAAKQLQFFAEEIQIVNETGFGCSWVSQDNSELFAPALDLQTGIRVICGGRIAWDESHWQKAAKLERYKGGLSNRLLLDIYQQSGIEGIERSLNGSAVVLIWDPIKQQVHLLTDRFGYYPIFLYQPEQVNSCVIASFPDAIADNPATRTSWDYASMAEFMWQCRATPPHTYYQEIKYAGAATHCLWDLGQQTYHRREYWQPFQAGFFENISEAAEQLIAAVSHSIQIRTLPRLQPIVSYTSGGLDSRVILFASAERDRHLLSGLNLYDVPNQESAAAMQLCHTAGVDYVGFARDEDYYPRWLHLGAKYSGGMWSGFDNHFLGTRDLVCDKLAAHTVLSACSTDFLFKFANLERRSAKFLGQHLPWMTFGSKWSGGFLDPPMSYSHSLPSMFGESIRQRLNEWFGDAPKYFANDLERLQVEDKRNRPMCYAGGLSFPLLFNCFPYDAFMADIAIAQCYSRTPAKWKLNSSLWSLVSARIGGQGIADANYGWRPGASKSEQLLKAAQEKIKRQLRSSSPNQNVDQLATEGSWPNMSWYVLHSPTIRQLWEATTADERQLITDLLGSDPWQIPLEQWAQRVNTRYFFNILTLLSYWAVRRG